MNNYGIILSLIWTHYLADFVFQSDEMAKNKSKSLLALLAHITVYCAVLLLWVLSLILFVQTPVFTLISFAGWNALFHLVTDYFTSKLSARLWALGRTHDFFVVVGWDQAIHTTTLIVSANIMGLI